MTMSRKGGELHCDCDHEDCSKREYAGVLEFTEFAHVLKETGWEIIKEGEDWIHYCPVHAGSSHD